MPAIHEKEKIRAGTALPILDRGIGRLRHTGKLISLWGHRATPTNGRPHGPFYFIDKLDKGDEIILATDDDRTQTFTVTRHRIVRERQVGIFFRERKERMLTIAACTKADGTPTSAEFRYVIFAKEAV